MARLNEPPIAPAPSLLSNVPAGESLEALKRRFIRQNRELAKNNSAQSLKIRGLELEVSRLLGANLELREKCMRLERDKRGKNGLGRVQRELRQKLEELSGLVDGLQQLHPDDDDDGGGGGGGGDVGDDGEEVDLQRVLSPSHQQYRERQPLAEVMRESQMPTISEGKSYPRQTLDASEIRAMRISDGSSATGSPDLGPPPVARFDCGERDGGDLLPSVNLETRRKRKDGLSEREIRRSSILPQSPVELDVEPTAPSILRTGAKRKLADREGERTAKKEDFSFTRKPTAEAKKEDENDEKAPTSPAKSTRRVLADKSVNQSPRKAAPPAKPTKPAKDEPIKPVKPTSHSQPTARAPSRGRRTSSAPQLQPAAPVMTSIELPPPAPPATPAPLEDPFSPSTASAPQHGNKDTPPPADLSSLSNTTTETRPSRRARNSVNYAEPSLVAKMRRPGKGMVDAISGLPAARRSISADVSTVQIKVEPVEDDESWKVQGSPSARKSTAPGPRAVEDDKIVVAPVRRESSSALVAESRRKREAISRRSSSASSSVSISPPVSTTSADAAAEKLADMQIQEQEKRKAEMDIFEFKDDSSSPVAGEIVGMGAKGRRHSSVLRDVGGGKVGTVGGKLGMGKVGGTAAGSRRRSMML